MKTVWAIACAAACLGGCATPLKTACAPGERSAEVVRLSFDRNVGGGRKVSEADWEAFVDSQLAPRFPDGLSVIDTAGVWRGPGGTAVHELGKSVVIVLPGRANNAAPIAAVTAAYRTKFSQDSALVARSHACVAS